MTQGSEKRDAPSRGRAVPEPAVPGPEKVAGRPAGGGITRISDADYRTVFLPCHALEEIDREPRD